MGVTKGLPLIGRLLGGGARATGRAVPRVAKVAGAATALAGAGWLISRSLSGTNGQTTGGDSGGNATSMGGGGLSGGRAGLASSRGFTAPNNDNSPRKVSYNPNGNFETESLRLQASSANSLASIDNTVRNMLKFSVAKATWDTRSLREMSIEASNNTASGFAGGAGGNGMFNAVNGNQQGGISPLLIAGLTAAALGVGAAIVAFNKIFGGGGDSSAGGGGAPSGAQGSLGAPAGSFWQQVGVASVSAGYANDAANRIRATPARPIAANDNRAGRGGSGARGPSLSMAASQGRLGSALGSGAGRGVMKVFRFLKGLRATPVGRFPILTSVFALIDPLEAALTSGANSDSFKRELVGAIAMIIAGPAGVAMGAAVGAAISIPATPVGMAVGAILGGLAGAIAALSAEFVAEQIYDLIAGNITLGEFARKLGRGAMNGLRNSAALAGGAILGGGMAAIGMARAGARAAAPVVDAAAGAARTGIRVSGRAVAGIAAATVVGGSVIAAAVQPRAPALSGPALMNMSGGELHTAARTAAEQYLGRQMTQTEWDYLLRAVYAESGRGGGGRENAMIMATILNRARSPQGYTAGALAQAYLRQGLTVLAALYGRNQFQAVTGTAGNPRPSSHFSRGPNHNELEEILRSVVQFLHKVPHNQVAFTAAATGAYGAGTNIGYRDTMLRNGGVVIGGTVFNTQIAGENIAQTVAPAPAPNVVAPATTPAPQVRPPAMSGSSPPATAGVGSGSGAPSGDEGGSGQAAAVSPPTGPALETLRRYNLKDESHIAGLKGPFASKMANFLHAAAAAGKSIKIMSGYRSHAHQARLYADAVAKYGAAGARRWVAPPGRSKHNHGLAIDLVYGNNTDARGTQSAAGRAAKMWAHANAARFGLNFRMGHEPWHIEPSGAVLPPGEPASPGAAAHAALPRTGGQRNMSLGAGAAGASIDWTGAAAPAGLSGGTPSYDSEGGSPVNAIAPATPEARTMENIVKASVAAEKKRMNIVVQNTQQQDAGKTIRSKTEKTDTSAAESVSSPVMAAYEYAAYWGVD